MTKRDTNPWVTVLGGVHALTVIALIASLVGLAMIDFQHTVTLPADTPGLLRTQQWGLTFWFVVLYLASVAVMVGVAPFRIADPADSTWRPYHLAWSFVMGIFCIAAVVVLTIEHVNVNTAENVGANIANDVRYDCAFANVGLVPPTNDFAPILSVACSPASTAESLKANSGFLVFWSFAWVATALAAAHGGIGFVIGNGRVAKDEFDEDLDEEDLEDAYLEVQVLPNNNNPSQYVVAPTLAARAASVNQYLDRCGGQARSNVKAD